MITEKHFKALMEAIDPMSLPDDLSGVADRLNVNRDRTGFALFPNQLAYTSERVVPKLYRTDEKETYILKDLFRHASLNIVPMHMNQAAAFVIAYVNQMRGTPTRAHTVWVPVNGNQYALNITVLRLFFRANGKFEMFAYAHDDPSRWAGGDDYLVAYHVYGA